MTGSAFSHVPRLIFVVLLAAYGQTVQAQDRSMSILPRLSQEAQAVARTVRSAVVQVKARRVRRIQTQGGSSTSLREEPSTGSGFFVDEAGYVVTNAHVVSGATDIWVERASLPPPAPGEASILRRRGTLLDAKVVGIDDETDVAVLKVPSGDYPTLSFGNSDALDRGQVVFAFGGPLGLENSMSMGIVSATARQFQPGDPMIYIQTDASINPGSSGGPLVNTDGDVVGINTLTASKTESSGLGFAGPSNIVEAVYKQIRAHGTVRRGGIGVHAQTITPELAHARGLDRSYRVILADVFPGGPAEQVGLQRGDIVTHLNGEQMHNGREFDVNLYPKAGSVVTLDIVRGDSTFEQKVRVKRQQGGRGRYASMSDPSEYLVEAFGILGIPLTEQTAPGRVAALRLPSGLVVASSSRPQTPWGDRLRPGDVLYAVDGERVESPESLRTLLDKRKGERVVAEVLRGSQMHYLVLPVDE